MTTTVHGQTSGSSMCPLCHTAGPTPGDDRLRPGVGWRCGVCGQAWDMNRLATVAAYATYSAERTALHALGTRGTGAQVLSMPQGGV